MKLKSKLILAAASLMVLSGAAAGTSAFAWFTANANATATSNFAVASNTDTLKIAAACEGAVSSTLFTEAHDADNNSTSLTATSARLTDVSGNGLDFYKPTFDTTKVINTITAVTSEGTSNYLNYLDVTLTFTRTNSGSAMALFLTTQTAVSQTGSKDLYKAIRIAILDQTQTENSKIVCYYADQDESGSMLYSADVANKAGEEVNSTNLATYPLLNNIIWNTGTPLADVTDATAATISQPGYLGQIAAGATEKVLHARIWVEGMDSDCSNTTSGGTFNVNLGFSGVKVNS